MATLRERIGYLTSAGCLSSFLLMACGTADDQRDYVTGPNDGALTTTAGMPAEKSGAAFGELPGDVKLAEVAIGDTHFVQFWRDASGNVAVLEGYHADLNPGSKVGNFRPRQDSLADLYLRLSGERADAASLERLRTVDAANRAIRESASARPNEKTAPGSTQTPEGSDGFVDKAFPGDATWFQNTHCIPRQRAADGEDLVHCHLASLAASSTGWTVTWTLQGFEQTNIALFDADTVNWARLDVSGRDCGLLPTGFCGDDWVNRRSMLVPPRWVYELRNTSDDGFLTSAIGQSFALHYMFWD